MRKMFLSTVNHSTVLAVTIMLLLTNISGGANGLGFSAFSLAASSCFHGLCSLQYEHTQRFIAGIVKHAF